MCGKNYFDISGKKLKTGSPPRVREKPNRCYSSLSLIGITPACAGKTLSMLWFVNMTQDHPRVCGKNFKRLVFEF